MVVIIQICYLKQNYSWITSDLIAKNSFETILTNTTVKSAY